MAEIEDICRPRNIKIIEDVAQAPLAKTGQRLVGTIGDMSCFSFYPSKNLGAFGDGGMILTNDDELAEAVLCLSNYGQKGRMATGMHDGIGYNSRLDALQAAVLLCKLPHLEKWTLARRRAAAKYDELLAPLPIKCPGTAPRAEPVYHLYVVQVNDRDACHAYLRDNGVMAQIHYPNLIHLQACYRELGYKKGDFPVSENACERIVSLPIYPEITDEQIHSVVETLARFIDKVSP
jgi:dTDP-4-amino-4,6-dideoxygalactose transaminase